jgi:murein DD-endopeptidase MepM/ murein hydrolase activator NlpD
MKWLLTFLAGAIIGAGSLFVYLRQIPSEPAPLVTTTAGALPAPAAAPAPAANLPEASLPPAPQVTADLTDVDLPLRPGAEVTAAVSSVPDLAAHSQARPGKLMVPVEGIAASALTDTFDQPRGKQRHHEALDIMAPKGTKVVAAADGKVVKLFTSKPGGLTVYQFDPTEKYAYYYAHLDRYAEGVKEGSVLKRGDLVGYVGVTGNSDPNAPHLHFAVVELTAEKQWWKGTPVNPYPLLAN